MGQSCTIIPDSTLKEYAQSIGIPKETANMLYGKIIDKHIKGNRTDNKVTEKELRDEYIASDDFHKLPDNYNIEESNKTVVSEDSNKMIEANHSLISYADNDMSSMTLNKVESLDFYLNKVLPKEYQTQFFKDSLNEISKKGAFIKYYEIFREEATSNILQNNGKEVASTISDIAAYRASQYIKALSANKQSHTKFFDIQGYFNITPIQSVDKKASIKSSIATQFIGFGEGIANSSTESYRKQAGEYANTGHYSSNDVIFISIVGKRGDAITRKEQQDKTIKEALKAIAAGATLITDNKAYTDSSDYNEGEKRLAKNLEAEGYTYSETIVSGQTLGVWTNNGDKRDILELANKKFKERSTSAIKEQSSNIYSQLGSKTKSENIELVSWGSLKNLTSPLTSNGEIVATRLKGDTSANFGNTFTPDSKIKRNNKLLTLVNNTKEAVTKYIEAVLYSNDSHYKWIREQIQSGNLKGKKILYYTELNEPSHATALDWLINSKDSPLNINNQNSSKLEEQSSLPDIKTPKEASAYVSPDKDTPRAKLGRDMSPIEIYNRKLKLARDFSGKINIALRKQIREAQDRLNALDVNDPDYAKKSEDINNEIKALRDSEQGRRQLLTTTLKPEDIFNMMREDYKEIVNYSDEDLEDAYGKDWRHVKEGYIKILNNFDALVEESMPLVEHAEKFKVITKRIDNKKGRDTLSGETKDSQDLTDTEEAENGDDENGKRVNGSEGWSENIRFQDSYDTQRAETRQVLSNIMEVKIDSDGREVTQTDDLQEPKYLREDYAHAVMLSELAPMLINPDDFSTKTKKEDGTYEYTLPALDKLVKKYPWMGQVEVRLLHDPRLISIFYNDMRKDFVPRWMQRDNKTFPLNMELPVKSMLKGVSTAYTLSTYFTKTPIYGSNFTVNSTNAKKVNDNLTLLAKEVAKAKKQNILLSNEVYDGIAYTLASVGFDISVDSLKALSLNGLRDVCNDLGSILDIAEKGNIDLNGLMQNTLNMKKQNAYNDIAKLIGEVSPLDNTMSFRQNGNNYQSYAVPNYEGTMIKQLSLGYEDNERRNAYIEKEFRAFDWFYTKDDNGGGVWHNKWLELLTDNDRSDEVRRMFASKDMDNIDDTLYENWTGKQIKKAFLKEYFAIPHNSNRHFDYAWYSFPIYADSKMSTFVRMPKFTGSAYKETLKPMFTEVVMQELKRMGLVQRRAEKGASPMQNFDKAGNKFCFFPELNDIIIDNKSFLEICTEFKRTNDIDGLKAFIGNQIEKVLNDRFTDYIKQEEFDTLDIGEIGGVIGSNKEEDVLNAMEEYFWNQTFATSQIIEMTVTDLAFYKDDAGIDFQKRFKEVYAAGTKLNTNSRYGRKTEKTIYLKDLIMTSATYAQKKSFLDTAVKEGRITSMDRDNILNKFQNINATDAQAFRSLASYRAILDMQGMWKDEMQETFDRLENNTWTMADFNTIWQTIKPFMYTQVSTDDGLGGKIKVGHQNKNSEFLLLATYQMFNSLAGKSDLMRAVSTFMKEYDIDVVQYESAVKVGGQGIIDLNYSGEKAGNAIEKKEFSTKDGHKYTLPDSIKSFDDIKAYFDKELNDGNIEQKDYNNIIDYFTPDFNEVYSTLKEEVTTNKHYETDVLKVDGDNKKTYNTSVVHELPYDDYMVAQANPEHLLDAKAVFGSQFRNIILSNITDETEVELPSGEKLKGKAILEAYQSCIVSNLLDDAEKLTGEINSIEDLQDRMLSIVKGNDKYGKDILDALQIVTVTDKDGNKEKVFNMPLHSLSTTIKIQEIINSMFKNAVTKQSIKGGTCVLVSDVGYTKELHLLQDKDGRVQYAQCYLPAFSKKFYEPFLKDVYKKDSRGNDTDEVIGKEIDIEKLRNADPAMLKLIGYRIPTESKYSMIPLLIKGFLPQENGSSIMLPSDMTTIAGWDFDVDKLFLMIPEFQLEKSYDIKKAWHDFYKANPDTGKEDSNLVREFNENVESTKESHKGEILDIENEETFNNFFNLYLKKMKEQGLKRNSLDGVKKEFSDWFKKNKKNYITSETYKKVQYDNNKPALNNSRQQRNNRIIDLATAILQSKTGAEEIMRPGNFDNIELESRIADIITDKDLLESFLSSLGINSNELNKDSYDKIIKELIKEGANKRLKDFIKKHKQKKSPLTPQTFIYNHKQNMVSKALIGIYANNTTGQAKYQGTDLAIDNKYVFEINGRKIQSLHDIYTIINDKRIKISDNNAEFSAASVDGVKNPVLAKLMQNKNTASITCFMLRSGMSIREISLLFNSPIVKKVIDIDGDLSNLEKYIKASIDAYNGVRDNPKVTFKDIKITNRGLLTTIINDTLPKYKYTPQTLSYNIAAAMKMLHIYNMSQDLSDLTRITRADSPNGAIGRSLAIAKKQTMDVELFNEKSRAGLLYLTGTEGIIANNVVSQKMGKIEKLQRFMSSKIPMLQAMYSLGIELGLEIDKKYFVQLSDYADSMLNALFINSPHDTVDVGIIEKFYSELITFGLSDTTLLGDDPDNGETYEGKRDYYLYKFPQDLFKKLSKEENKDIASLSAIRLLEIKDGKLIINESARVNDLMKQMLMSDFDNLLYMSGEKAKDAQEIAVDLLRYVYYSEGTQFGPNSIGNLLSTTFYTSFPEYVKCLRDMEGSIIENKKWSKFLPLFYLNNYIGITSKGVLRQFVPRFKLNTDDINGDGIITVDTEKATSDLGVQYEYIKLDSDSGELLLKNTHNSDNSDLVEYSRVKTPDTNGIPYYNINGSISDMQKYKRKTYESSKVEQMQNTAKSLDENNDNATIGNNSINADSFTMSVDSSEMVSTLQNGGIDNLESFNKKLASATGDETIEGSATNYQNHRNAANFC
jgi:hypothetical protein